MTLPVFLHCFPKSTTSLILTSPCKEAAGINPMIFGSRGNTPDVVEATDVVISSANRNMRSDGWHQSVGLWLWKSISFVVKLYIKWSLEVPVRDSWSHRNISALIAQTFPKRNTTWVHVHKSRRREIENEKVLKTSVVLSSESHVFVPVNHRCHATG